jgi:ADP-ribose pyrophosphatase YjhB (NUDIX family)
MDHQPQNSPKIAVNAIVFNNQGEVLLAKRTDNRLWCIPGGHVELGETLAQACERELWEETGLNAEVVRLIGVYSDTAGSLHIAQGKEWHTVRVSFLCRVTGGELRLSGETNELKYYPVDSLPPMITDHPKRILDALEGLPEAVIA